MTLPLQTSRRTMPWGIGRGLRRLGENFDFAVLTVFTVFLLPFLSARSTLDPGLLPRFLGWGVMLFLLSLSLVAQTTMLRSRVDLDGRILTRRLFLAFLGYSLACLVSLCQAVNLTEGAFEVVKTFMGLTFLVFAALILSRNRRYLPLLAQGVVLAALLLSGIGFYQYLRFGLLRMSGPYSLTGTMAQKNLFASALFLMLPFCLYVTAGRRRSWRRVSSVTCVSILLLILLSQTRGVWLAVFGSGLLTAGVTVGLHRLHLLDLPQDAAGRLRKTVAGILLGVTLVGAIFGAVRLRSVSPRQVLAEARSTESMAQRFAVWRKTLELAEDNLFTGVGAGNWKIRLPSYGLPQNLPKDWLKTFSFVRPHNDYLWVLAETGIFGLLFYLLIFGVCLYYLVQILLCNPGAEDAQLAIYLFFGLVGYLIIAFFCFPRERVFHSVFLLLLMAAVTATYHRHFESTAGPCRSGLLAFAVCSLLLLPLGLALGYARAHAEKHVKLALAARMARNWNTVVSEIDQGYSPFATLDPMAIPLPWYRGEAHFLLGQVGQALHDYEEAYRVHPFHIHVLNNLATCCELTGDRDRARRYYQEALRLFPQFDEALANLVALDFRTGRYEEARRTLASNPLTKRNPTLERYGRMAAEALEAGDRPAIASGDSGGVERPAGPEGWTAVYRLWSPTRGRYVYTVDTRERDECLGNPQSWVSEGVAYRAFKEARIPGLQPVYRLYSIRLNTHLYTIRLQEKNQILREYPDNWQDRGVAFFAFPEGQQPADAVPVYRFWADALGYHLYTIDRSEKDRLVRDYADVWSYEGVAWYAYK